MWFIGVEVEQETSAPPPKKKSWIRRRVFLFLLLLFYGTGSESLTANILYCQGLHLEISWKFHNFLVFPEIVYNKCDS